MTLGIDFVCTGTLANLRNTFHVLLQIQVACFFLENLHKMRHNYGGLLTRHLPVLNPKNACIVNIMQRLVWNTGLWSKQSLGLHWLAKFVVICFLLMNLTQVVTLVMERHNSSRIYECFSVMSFCSMGALKLFNLYANKKRWLFIISQVDIMENEQINNIREESNSDEHEHAYRFIQRYTKRHIFITSLLLKLYSITAIIFIVTPFIEYALDRNEKARYPHILAGWVPLDEIGFIGYLIHITFETVGAVYCVAIHVAFDCTSVGIMIFICGQFSFLRHNTENIAGRGKYCGLSTARDTRAHLRIIKSHGTHTALCTVIKELDSCLRSILGVYFLVATLTVCSVAVRLNSETLSIMQLVSLLQYMCGTLTQLFLFCRYGDAVFHESSFKMGEGPFAAAWWAARPRVRRELAVLGAAMMLPRPLHAGPFNTVDLPSFVQIVKTAYSYYAVLGQTSK